MARQLDPRLAETLKKYGATKDDLWDCHGTWVVYHAALERVAATAGINFDPPQILEADGDKRCVALCVSAEMAGKREWSIGEASPHNYIVKGKMQAYPYAMAEKRGKDRVILKLIGLAGLVYSEEEADDFKSSQDRAPAQPEPAPAKSPAGITAIKAGVREHLREINACSDADSLLGYINKDEFKAFAFKVCRFFPSEWLGPEDNSGLSGSLASVGADLKCESDVQLYIAKMERARDAANQQPQAAE